MNRFWLCWVLLLCSGNVMTGETLPESAEISLLTCTQGTELYSIFGHSAIRVKNPETMQDVVYNYGTFNFRTPNFYLKFIRGQLNYRLSANYYARFHKSYVADGRGISEQILLLNQEQKQTVYDFLQNNNLPENREYQYDFFFDNCATRIRDIPFAGGLGELNYPALNEPKAFTFRQLLDQYLAKSYWSDFGIDLILGLPADAVATTSDMMFLPDYLAMGFAGASIQDSIEHPLVASTTVLLPATQNIEATSFWLRPIFVFSCLLVLTIALTYFFQQSRLLQFYDSLLLFTAGFAGLIFLMMWLATDHDATFRNMNLLWANPLLLLLFPLISRKQNGKILQKLAWFCVGLMLLVLIGWWILPQQFHIAIIPIILTLLVRVIARLFRPYSSGMA